MEGFASGSQEGSSSPEDRGRAEASAASPQGPSSEGGSFFYLQEIDTDHVDTTSLPEDNKQGRRGEHFTWLCLTSQHGTVAATWENGDGEALKPYDITLELPGERTRYIEVKSSKADWSEEFYLTQTEYKWAIANEDNYDIYRVAFVEGEKPVLYKLESWAHHSAVDRPPKKEKRKAMRFIERILKLRQNEEGAGRE